MDHLLSYFLICLLLVVSPGPNTFLIINTASNIGKYDSMLKIAGLFSATYVHGLLSLFGVSLIVLHSPALFTFIKLLGAAYLLYLGLKFVISSFKTKATAMTINTESNNKSALANFNQGFLTQILNPKVSIFYLAAFPQFINFSDSNRYISGIMLISIHAMTIAIWFILITFSINIFSNQAKNSKIANSVSLISGIFLIYFAFLLISQPLPA